MSIRAKTYTNRKDVTRITVTMDVADARKIAANDEKAWNTLVEAVEDVLPREKKAKPEGEKVEKKAASKKK